MTALPSPLPARIVKLLLAAPLSFWLFLVLHVPKGGTHDIVNNVIYDWMEIPAEVYDVDSNSFLNFVGNYFKPGRSEKEPGGFEIIINSAGVPRLYVEGNEAPHRAAGAPDEWSLVSYKWNRQIAPANYRAFSRCAAWPVSASSATEALPSVLAGAGAILPARDTVDARIVADVKNGTGTVINAPKDVGGYPQLDPGVAPPDSDHDGIPDDWEKAHGLDPANAADGSARAKPDGYTHVEEYLHSLLR